MLVRMSSEGKSEEISKNDGEFQPVIVRGRKLSSKSEGESCMIMFI